jgi:hypothetical protein
LFRLLSIPRIPCRCCDEYILTRTKSPPHLPEYLIEDGYLKLVKVRAK